MGDKVLFTILDALVFRERDLARRIEPRRGRANSPELIAHLKEELVAVKFAIAHVAQQAGVTRDRDEAWFDDAQSIEIAPAYRHYGNIPPSGSVECPHCHWGFAPTVIDQHIREKH